MYKMEKLRSRMELTKQELKKKYENYVKSPTTHPAYLKEWQKFRGQFSELFDDCDYKEEWKSEWKKIMEERLKMETEIKESIIKAELRINNLEESEKPTVQDSNDIEIITTSIMENVRQKTVYKVETSRLIAEQKYTSRERFPPRKSPIEKHVRSKSRKMSSTLRSSEEESSPRKSRNKKHKRKESKSHRRTRSPKISRTKEMSRSSRRVSKKSQSPKEFHSPLIFRQERRPPRAYQSHKRFRSSPELSSTAHHSPKHSRLFPRKAYSPRRYEQLSSYHGYRSHNSSWTESHIELDSFSTSRDYERQRRSRSIENERLPEVSSSRRLLSPRPLSPKHSRRSPLKNLSPRRFERWKTNSHSRFPNSSTSPHYQSCEKAVQSTISLNDKPLSTAETYNSIENTVPEADEPLTILSVLSLLTALEDYLGSLGPKVIALMSKAILMEKNKINSSNQLLDDDDHCVMFETVQEKLKGLLIANLVEANKTKAFTKAIKNMDLLIHEANERQKVCTVPVSGSTIPSSSSQAFVNGEPSRAESAVTSLIDLKRTIDRYIASGKKNSNNDVVEQQISSMNSINIGNRYDSIEQTTKDQISSIPPVSTVISMSSPVTVPHFDRIEIISENPQMTSTHDQYSTHSLSVSELKILIKKFEVLTADEKKIVVEQLQKLKKEKPESFKLLMTECNLFSSGIGLPTMY